jgi:hypothetical protein
MEIVPGFKREKWGCLKEGYPCGIATIFNAKSTHQKECSSRKKTLCWYCNRIGQQIAFLVSAIGTGDKSSGESNSFV